MRQSHERLASGDCLGGIQSLADTFADGENGAILAVRGSTRLKTGQFPSSGETPTDGDQGGMVRLGSVG